MPMIHSTNMHTTTEWKGYGKQTTYWDEYRLEGDVVCKYKCQTQKDFDGKGGDWEDNESLVESWAVDDPEMPELGEPGIRHRRLLAHRGFPRRP